MLPIRVIHTPPATASNMFLKVYLEARAGMATALYEHLSSLRRDGRDVAALLNQVHTEGDNVLTPLMIAARNGHERAVKVLLGFGPALEAEGTVTFDECLIPGATALWCAAGGGHLAIVKQLVHAGADVDHATTSRSSPVRAACYEGKLDIVAYLCEHGANINARTVFNNSCLMIAAFKGFPHLVELLLERGADANAQANCKATALHFASECRDPSVVRMLLEAGAEVVSNDAGMTFLMCAADAANPPVVDYFLSRPEASDTHRIDAWELLGASLAANKERYDLRLAYEYLERAMRCRYRDAPERVYAKTVKAGIAPYNFHVESQTLAEVELLRTNPSGLHMEALVIRERILGASNPEVPLSIIYRGAMFADDKRFDRCLQLWLYALKLKFDNETSVQKDLLRFAQVFCQMIQLGMSVDYDMICQVLEATVTQLMNNERKLIKPGPNDDVKDVQLELQLNMVTSLYLIAIALNTNRNSSNTIVENNNLAIPVNSAASSDATRHQTTKSLTTAQCRELQLHKLIYRLVKLDPRTSAGRSLLHLAVSADTIVDDFHISGVCRLPCQRTVRSLVACGACVDSRDGADNTPLHVIVCYRRSVSDFLTLHGVMTTLLKANAHLDPVNAYGLTPMQCCVTSAARMVLKSRLRGQMRLTCLAARAIVATGLNFRGCLPASLEELVLLHAPSGGRGGAGRGDDPEQAERERVAGHSPSRRLMELAANS